MDMRELIRGSISRSPSSHKAQKARECLGSLEAYVGEDAPVDCLEVVSTGWLDGFERFMTSPGASRKGALSAATAAFRRKMLASYCREAIKRRLCPNIKISPGAGESDSREIGTLADPPRRKDMERLLSLFHLRKERSVAADIPEAARADAAAQARGLGYAALGTLLCGVGYAGLSRLLKGSPEAGGAVRLPHLDAEIELPPHLLEMLAWLRSAGGCISARSVEWEALAAARGASLSFGDGFREPFVQWIGLAVEGGLPRGDARRLIDRLYGGGDGDGSLVRAAFDAAASRLSNFGYSWYCVRSALKGDAGRSGGAALLREVETSAGIRPVDSLCPRLRVVKDRDGRKETRYDGLWDSLLLVRVNRLQAEALNRFLMSGRLGFIYGIPGEEGMTYSRVPDMEVGLIRGYFEGLEGRRASGRSDLAGRRASVLTGLYGGYDGTVVKAVVDREGNVSRLVLKLRGAGATVTYSADPDYLELHA